MNTLIIHQRKKIKNQLIGKTSSAECMEAINLDKEKGVEKTLMLLFPKKYEAQVLSVWARCQKKVFGK